MKFRVYPLELVREKEMYKASLCVCTNKDVRNLDSIASKVLHSKEFTLFRELLSDNRRNSYVMGRLAAKLAVSKLIRHHCIQTISIGNGVFHQPILNCHTPSNLNISIAHTDTFAAAIAFPEQHPMGIDIQNVSKDYTSTIEGICTSRELDMIGNISLPYPTALTSLWTAKESLSKVLKTGFMSPVNLYELTDIFFKDKHMTGMFTNFSQYKNYSWITERNVLSISYPRRTEIHGKLKTLWRFLNGYYSEYSGNV